jgi:alpha-tubulin suppressor-like RCC1 family protein
MRRIGSTFCGCFDSLFLFVALVLLASSASANAIVFSFGSNSAGELGLGFASTTNTSIATPVNTTLIGDRRIVRIAAHTASMLLADDGTAFVFGSHEFAMTGMGTETGYTPLPTPLVIPSRPDASLAAIAPGGLHGLVVAKDGTIFSFGLNTSGRTGLGTSNGTALVPTPILTTNLSGEKIVEAAAGFQTSLLLSSEGNVYGMGTNRVAGIGNFDGNSLVATPIDATNLAGKRVTQIATTDLHGLLLTEDGTVFAVGQNSSGKTGLRTSVGYAGVATAIDTTNLDNRRIVQIAAGREHSLILAEDGTVFAFGSNQYKQTGLNTTAAETRIATPIDTTNLDGRRIVDVAAGDWHSLLLAEDGTVFSFGRNIAGATGLGISMGTTPIATQIDMTNLAGLRVIGIAAGNNHNLLLAVPEPSSVILVALALAGMTIHARRLRGGRVL